MGLFKKSSPAEKKLKELTGGFILSSDFINRLKEQGLKIQDGTAIQRKLKDEIKEGLSAEEVPIRLNVLINECKEEKNIQNSSDLNIKNCPECGTAQERDNLFCIDCGYEFNSVKMDTKKTCPSCRTKQDMENDFCINCGFDFKNAKTEERHGNEEFLKSDDILDFKNKTAFLSNFDFNLKTCPDCNTQLLKVDPFCFNCGSTVVTHETVKNENLEVKDGKLVAKDETKKDEELSSLEALYSQTVKSKYSPSFKVAYVLYLEQFRKNPLKKFSDKTAKMYETTVNKLKKQALEDEFIEIASPLAAAKDAKVTELKEILKEHNLKVSGKKDELIERLGENLSDDELKKYFKSKNYQISEKGLEFLENNNYILYIYDNPDVSRVFDPSRIYKIFEERHYSTEEIHETLLANLKKMFDDKLTNEVWVDFKSYANAIAFVQEDKGDLKDALNMRFKVFLFDLNNYSVVMDKPDPRNTKLRKKDVAKMNELMHRLTLPIDELKDLFSISYKEVLFAMDISKDDALIYLLRVFGGEDLDVISKDINERYFTPF